MANYPAELDDSSRLPKTISGRPLNEPQLSTGQNNQNDSIIALERKVGTGNDTPTANSLLVSRQDGQSEWSLKAPKSDLVGTSDAQTLSNKTIAAPNISNPIVTNANVNNLTASGSVELPKLENLKASNATVDALTSTGAITVNGTAHFKGNIESPEGYNMPRIVCRESKQSGTNQIAIPIPALSPGYFYRICCHIELVGSTMNTLQLKFDGTTSKNVYSHAYTGGGPGTARTGANIDVAHLYPSNLPAAGVWMIDGLMHRIYEDNSVYIMIRLSGSGLDFESLTKYEGPFAWNTAQNMILSRTGATKMLNWGTVIERL